MGLILRCLVVLAAVLAVQVGAVNRCGSSYTAAEQQCSKCPGGTDGECGSGETCYAGLPDCTSGNGGGSDSGSGNGCGASYDDAATTCRPCPSGTDSECASGESCFADVTACAGGGGTSGTGGGSDGGNANGCGTSFSDAGTSCRPCPNGTDGECASGESCFADVTACGSSGGSGEGSGSGTGASTVGCDTFVSEGTTWATFSNEQKSNACTVVGVGKGAAGVPEKGWVVAIATALVESRVLALDCGDQDSEGVFQQRTGQGWCDDVADCVNPVTSSFAFYGVASHTSNPGLTDISGWEAMSVNDAAQAVQVSEFPDRYGEYEDSARGIVAACANTPAIFDEGSGVAAVPG